MKTTMQNITNWKATLTFLTIGAFTLLFTTGAKPPSGPIEIPLCVTIEPVGALGSDGLGDYFDGVKGVRAVFKADQGRFSFDTGSRRKANVTIPGAFPQGNYNIHFLISRDQQDPNVNTNPDPNWQDLDLDQLPIGTSTPVGLHFVITTSPSDTGSWRVAFGDYPLATDVNPFPCDDAAPAVVTRVDANTWTLVANDTGNHCLTHGFIDPYNGQITFPFKMTLRRK